MMLKGIQIYEAFHKVYCHIKVYAASVVSGAVASVSMTTAHKVQQFLPFACFVKRDIFQISLFPTDSSTIRLSQII